MTTSTPAGTLQAKCVAHSKQTSAPSDASPEASQKPWLADSYRNLQWSSDGTCLIGTDYSNTIKTFIVPPDLLEPHDKPQIIDPYCSISSSEPVSAVAGVPFFDLQTPSTALVLSSQRDHPLRLSSALTGERIAAYPLINPLTEAYVCPNALAFSLDGRHIIAGSESLLSVFDISCPGQEPLHAIQTGPKRGKDDRWNPSTSVRGVISTLDVEPASNMLAVGTFSRQIGLYEAGGVGECVAAFSVAGNDADKGIGGRGVTQVRWSPCGRYLYVGERKSDGIVLYDIRKTGQLLSWCKGRRALTNQRLAFDVASPGDDAHEVWAGGNDGLIRVWKDAHKQEGAVASTWESAGHEDPISGLAFHRSGGVLATSSGQDYFKVSQWEPGKPNNGHPSLKIGTVDST